jgi:hypothetical protein
MMNINPMQFMQRLQQLKSQGGDPNQMIQQMMNSGRVTQAQYDAAVKQAQQIQKMFTPSGRR